MLYFGTIRFFCGFVGRVASWDKALKDFFDWLTMVSQTKDQMLDGKWSDFIPAMVFVDDFEPNKRGGGNKSRKRNREVPHLIIAAHDRRASKKVCRGFAKVYNDHKAKLEGKLSPEEKSYKVFIPHDAETAVVDVFEN